jgi:hypothetical protein
LIISEHSITLIPLVEKQEEKEDKRDQFLLPDEWIFCHMAVGNTGTMAVAGKP